jgi:hypothetical protein
MGSATGPHAGFQLLLKVRVPLDNDRTGDTPRVALEVFEEGLDLYFVLYLALVARIPSRSLHIRQGIGDQCVAIRQA